MDGRFDVICSGALMGINYHEIESNSVGFEEDYEMHSLDFEEFLWAKGYKPQQIEDLYQKMISITPLSQLEYDVMLGHFREYLVLGGMPAVVSLNVLVDKDKYSDISFGIKPASAALFYPICSIL